MKKIHLEPMIKEKPAYWRGDFLLIVSVLIAALVATILVAVTRLGHIDHQIEIEERV